LITNSKGISHPNKEEKPLDSVYISHMKGVSEKFKRTVNRYNIRTIFKTKNTFRGSLMKIWPERDAQQMAQCIYSIHCECGRSYIGETVRPLALRLCNHRHNFKEGLLEKTKLVQCTYEEDHKIGWDEARILCKLKVKANIENRRNPAIWQA
jgi:predicted GIY-YIG superfamily endonuclease